MNNLMKLGDHFICDLSDCDQHLLLDPDRSGELFTRAVVESGLTIVDTGFYKFSPHGFTCFLLLAESHASLHAWPEFGYCAIDLFTCNPNLDITPLINRLQEIFSAASCDVRRLDRAAQINQPVVI